MEIKQQLARITTLVEQWDGAPSALERDLVLEKLRALYDAVAAATQPEKAQEPRRKPTPPPAPEPQWAPDEPPFDPEPMAQPNATPRPAVPDLFDVAPAGQPAAKPAPGRIDKKKILSLYGESETGPSGAKPHAVLGEVLQSPSEDLAGRVAASRTRDLRSAIGINDKFLIISEVFGGSAPAYEQAIDELDAFTDLNEAMIHIHETYAWNPHNEGVKTLVEILARKLS